MEYPYKSTDIHTKFLMNICDQIWYKKFTDNIVLSKPSIKSVCRFIDVPVYRYMDCIDLIDESDV